MADKPTDNPDVIERDIERTQDAIGDTVEKIEQKLSPKEVTRSILGDDRQAMVREGLKIARENPVPVAMIAIGAIWLFATSGSPMIKRLSDRLSGGGGGGGDDHLRSRDEEPAPIGPPPAKGEAFDRRRSENAA